MVTLAKYIARTLLLVAQSSSAERRGALDRVRHLWWNMGTKLGRSQQRAGFAGRLSRSTTSLCRISCPKVEKGKRETAVKMPLLPCHEVSTGFLGVTCRVNSRPTRRIPTTGLCAPNEVRFHDRLSVSSGLGAANEQTMATGSSAEVSDPLSCPLRSLTNFLQVIWWVFWKRHTSCGTHVLHAACACRIQVSRASYINRKRWN